MVRNCAIASRNAEVAPELPNRRQRIPGPKFDPFDKRTQSIDDLLERRGFEIGTDREKKFAHHAETMRGEGTPVLLQRGDSQGICSESIVLLH